MKNEKCKYKCHANIESCDFCFCPFYPCKIEELGRFKEVQILEEAMYERFSRRKISFHGNLGIWMLWDCSNCTLVHNKKVAKILSKVINGKEWYNLFNNGVM